MFEQDKLFLLSDKPLDQATEFNFDLITDTLLSFLVSPSLESPFNICINGTWGAGKTTLLNSLAKKIEEYSRDNSPDSSGAHFIPIWFEPWKLADEMEVLTALVSHVLQHVERHAGPIKTAKIEVERKDILRLFSERFLNINPDELSSYFQWDSRQRGTFIEVENLFRKIAESYLQDKGRFVIFVDDLDRCPPKRVVAVLETIKLFFDMQGFVFFFALDLEQIEKALISAYDPILGPQDARVYLEKIFQLIYRLPQKDLESLAKYVSQRLSDQGSAIHNPDLIRALIETFGRNLRNLKLFLNKFTFHRHLIHETRAVDDEVLFKWLYLETQIPVSLNASIRKKSLGLVIALEFLSQGAILYNINLYNRYVKFICREKMEYLQLIIYSLLSINDSNDVLSDENLSAMQLEIVNALRKDCNTLNIIEVLREGNAFLIDCDLSYLAYLSRREDISPQIDTVLRDQPQGERLSLAQDTTILSASRWNQLGDTYKIKNSNRSAYFCYLMAILINPYSGIFWCDIADTYRNAGNFRAAMALYKYAEMLSPPAGYVLSSLAQMYDINLGDEDTGTLMYLKLIAMGRAMGGITYNLAHNLRNQREPDYEGAFYTALHAFRDKPDDEKRRRLLEQLAGDIGIGNLDFSGWNDQLAEILHSAIQQGKYPRSLTPEEEQQIEDLIGSFPDLTEVREEICSLPS